MRRPLIFLSTLVLALALVQPALAAKPFPEVIPLPNGFQPEGIAIGHGTTFFAGSIPTGAIFRGDVRTGDGGILVPMQSGRAAIGMALDPQGKRLFVAGGPTGQGYVYDASTGDTIEMYQFTTETMTFVNDVVVTREAAYFTDSFQPVIYRVPVGPGGTPGSSAETIPLSGDFQFDPNAFNTNGIDATPNGKQLVVVNSAFGALYTVDPATGVATEIDLGGDSVPNGDGILLDGKTLYVVQNQLNQIAVVCLSSDLSNGTVVAHITDSDFDIPTTIAEFGNRLYAVNARFGTPATPDTEYQIVQVPKR